MLRDFVGGFLILSHHPAKFGAQRPCESEDITFFICHVTTCLMCHMTLWMGFILSDHPAKFRVHRSYETRNNGVCNIYQFQFSSISNSNSNAGVLMPRFTNGLLFPFTTNISARFLFG